MKSKFEGFLLRDAHDESVFRERHAEQIEMYKAQYLDWFLRSFPLYKWKKIRVRPESAEFVIGLLCILHLEGSIQFTIQFPDDGSIEIQREATASPET